MDPLVCLLLMPILPLVAAVLQPWCGRWGPAIGTIASLLGVGTALVLLGSEQIVTWTQPWVPSLGIELRLCADAFALFMCLVVSGAGAAVTTYAGGYFAGDPGRPRVVGLLLAFQAAMLLLVLADNLWWLFVCWEVTSVLSFLLIAHDGTPAQRTAAKRALLITGGGGLALMGAFALMMAATGTATLSEFTTPLHDHPWYGWILGLALIGCATKSALFPFHFWLPGAMAAPTPVSAYLHAATMVKAGVFLLARLHPALGGSSEWQISLSVMAALTVAFSVVAIPRCDDLKQMLAYSTLTALGIIAALLALDSEQGALAAVVMILAHALYKGALFLTIGSIDHGTGTRDLRLLTGLATRMPLTAIAALLGAASLAGLPPWMGYVAKQQAKLAADGVGWLTSATLLLGGIGVTAAAVCIAYGPWHPSRRRAPLTAHESPPSLTIPALVLAIAGLVAGLAMPWVGEHLLRPAAVAVAGGAVAEVRDPFPGSLAAFATTLAVLGVGTVLALARRQVARLMRHLDLRLAARTWDAGLEAALAGGRAVTRVLHSGDLRTYVSVALLAMVAAAVVGLASSQTLPRPPVDPLPFTSLPILLLVAVAAIGAATAPHRLSAIACLGAVGYGVALLFVWYGAPDLALTQVLAETLLLLLLVMAFRHLPTAFGARRDRRWWNLGLALVVGASVAYVTALAKGGQLAESIGGEIAARSLIDGFGRNVVNVILVDMRALDTLGEIVVLAIAGAGVAAMAGSGTPQDRPLARSLLLSTALRVLLPLLALTGMFFYWRGHNAPGGGFAGGLLLASGIVLAGIALGAGVARRLLPLGDPAKREAGALRLSAAGLGLAVCSGIPGMIAGGAFLTPLWGSVAGLKLGTPLLFDLGVMVLVSGVAAGVVLSLAEAEPEEPQP